MQSFDRKAGIPQREIAPHPVRARISWRRLFPVALIFVLSVVIISSGWHQEMTLAKIVALRDQFQGTIASHLILSVAIYVFVYTTIISLSLPSGGLTTIAGGLLFGWLIGGLAALLAATLGASILFQITRLAAGKQGTGHLNCHVQKLQAGFQKDALNYLLFLRLVPIFPFCIVNIVPALLGVRFRTFIIGTALGILPGTFAFSSVGAGLDSVIAAAKTEQAACLATKPLSLCPLSLRAAQMLTPELTTALVLLSVLALLPIAFNAWRRRHA